MTEPEELEHAILGGPAELTGDEVAQAAGLTVKQAQRLWRALGFPEAGEERAFSKLDVEALTRVARFMGQGRLDFDTIVRLTRGMGTTMDRLAEWEVATLTAVVEASPEVSSRRVEALRLVEPEAIGIGLREVMKFGELDRADARVESFGDRVNLLGQR